MGVEEGWGWAAAHLEQAAPQDGVVDRKRRGGPHVGRQLAGVGGLGGEGVQLAVWHGCHHGL